MAPDLKTNCEPSVTSLVTGILDDAQRLFKQQFEMLKAEVRDDLRKTSEVGITMVLGAGFALAGGILLAQALVYVTQWLFPNLPLWACCGIWGVVAMVCGGILVFVAKNLLDQFNPLPQKTAESLKENIEAITHPAANPTAQPTHPARPR
jgi:hypothetical protein